MIARAWAVICHHYQAAWSVADALFQFGWPGRVVCLKQAHDGPSLMELYGNGVEVWEVSLRTPGDLIAALERRIPAEDPKVLFFTDERYLETVLENSSHPWLKNATFHPAPECRMGTILDRFELYAFARAQGIAATPKTIPGDADPLAVFGTTFFYRFKRTWNGMRKLPRPELIESAAQFESARDKFRSEGYAESDWCFQEKLSIEPSDNVSVSGWHDARDPVYVATRKILQFPARQGNGDVCEIIPITEQTRSVTRRLLDALRFSGPFELEFVLDGPGGEPKIIELNPRFWMQHGLVGAATGQVVVRRYLGLSGAAASLNGKAPRYWVNSIVALNRMLQMDPRGLPYLCSPRKVVVPPWGKSIRWLPRFLPTLWRRWRGQPRR